LQIQEFQKIYDERRLQSQAEDRNEALLAEIRQVERILKPSESFFDKINREIEEAKQFSLECRFENDSNDDILMQIQTDFNDNNNNDNNKQVPQTNHNLTNNSSVNNSMLFACHF